MNVRILVKKQMTPSEAIALADKLQLLTKEYGLDMEFNIYTDGF